MLTTFDLDEYVYDALRAGASGFLLKDVPADQLADGIRLVAQGEALLAPSATRRLIHEFARTSPARREPPPAMAELTPRELEVFRLIARGRSNAEIAGGAVRGRDHREDPRDPDPHEARGPRPGAGRRARVRERDRRARRR